MLKHVENNPYVALTRKIISYCCLFCWGGGWVLKPIVDLGIGVEGDRCPEIDAFIPEACMFSVSFRV